jgi:uncharacterized protein with ParB-like and HNH nuclease domain
MSNVGQATKAALLAHFGALAHLLDFSDLFAFKKIKRHPSAPLDPFLKTSHISITEFSEKINVYHDEPESNGLLAPLQES